LKKNVNFEDIKNAQNDLYLGADPIGLNKKLIGAIE